MMTGQCPRLLCLRQGLFVRVWRFWRHYVALNSGAVGGVDVQLLQIRGIELDPGSAGANDDTAVRLFGRFDGWAVRPGYNHEFRKVFDAAAIKAGVSGLVTARAAAHLRVTGDPVAGVNQNHAEAPGTQDRYYDARQLRAPVP